MNSFAIYSMIEWHQVKRKTLAQQQNTKENFPKGIGYFVSSKWIENLWAWLWFIFHSSSEIIIITILMYRQRDLRLKRLICPKSYKLLLERREASVMAHWLRELAALMEDLGFVPAATWWLNHQLLQLQGSWHPPLTESSRHTCGAHTYMQAKYSCT